MSAGTSELIRKRERTHGRHRIRKKKLTKDKRDHFEKESATSFWF